MSAKSERKKQIKANKVQIIQIDDSVITLITKVLAKGERIALSLEGTNEDGTHFVNEREVVAPVTKDAVAEHIDDIMTGMPDTPLPWNLKLVSPYVDPGSQNDGKIHLVTQRVWNLGQYDGIEFGETRASKPKSKKTKAKKAA